MITLNHERAGLAFQVVECSAGDSRNGLAIKDSFAIKYERQGTSDKCDFHGLPLARRFCGVERGGQKPIHTPNLVRIWIVTIIIFNLNLVASTKVDATVTSLGVTEFNIQFEVLKLVRGHKVDAGAHIGKQAIDDFPAMRSIFESGTPARHVFPVEKWCRFAPGRRSFSLQCRCSYRRPLQ